MASSVADAFYAISSVIVILASSALLLRRRSTEEDQRFVLSVALLSFVSIVAFLVVLSISLILAAARIRRADILISLLDAC